MPDTVVGSIQITTERSIQVKEITGSIHQWLRENRADEGILTISSKHTTAGVTINEAESGLMRDIENHLKELVPRNKGYEHDRVDNNAHAHLMTSLIGSTESVPVKSSELVLGTWQRILFVECDGPRSRSVSLAFVGRLTS
ncbi:MAG: YjbQ family protein [Candidatus Lokiarchaeota archaeon]|jgi:secondary thiamine-phosphate synthase enzyme|nr:YjbQ family protein [Candidatus Lokiarchaeota archaeon]